MTEKQGRDQSYCAAQVRAYDHDRYLTALFAAEAGRDALMTLYAFNLEIAKTRETVSEPILGQMRLQWWRESEQLRWRRKKERQGSRRKRKLQE